jgi:hypothetical protein
MVTVRKLLQDEINLVNKFNEKNGRTPQGDIWIRISPEELDLEALDYSDSGGDESIVANSDSVDYRFEPLSIRELVINAPDKPFDVRGLDKGSSGSSMHRGIFS